MLNYSITFFALIVQREPTGAYLAGSDAAFELKSRIITWWWSLEKWRTSPWVILQIMPKRSNGTAAHLGRNDVCVYERERPGDRASGIQDVHCDSSLFVVTSRWIDGNRCCRSLSCLPLPITSAACVLVYRRVWVCNTFKLSFSALVSIAGNVGVC